MQHEMVLVAEESHACAVASFELPVLDFFLWLDSRFLSLVVAHGCRARIGVYMK